MHPPPGFLTLLNILSFTSLISFLPFHHITCALQPFLCNYVAYLPTLPLKSFFSLEWWNGEYTGFLSCLSGSCLKVQAWYEENILRGIPGGSLYIECVWGQMCVVNCVCIIILNPSKAQSVCSSAVCEQVYMAYEDTNLYNNMGITTWRWFMRTLPMSP